MLSCVLKLVRWSVVELLSHNIRKGSAGIRYALDLRPDFLSELYAVQ